MNMVKQLLFCDWVGVVISLAWGVVFILATQWGGVTKSWSDPSVIACCVLSVVFVIVFIAWEAYLGDKAMLPLKLFKSKILTGACIVAIFGWATFMLGVYYLSVGFQAAYK